MYRGFMMSFHSLRLKVKCYESFIYKKKKSLIINKETPSLFTRNRKRAMFYE